MKKLLTLLLSFCLYAFTVNAEDGYIYDRPVRYRIIDPVAKTCVIYKVDNCNGLPSGMTTRHLYEVNGYTVVDIEPFAFNFNDFVSVITLPGYLTRVPECLFAGAKQLLQVVLPESITEIHDGAFEACKNFWGINFPKKLRYIGPYAFSTTYISEVNLPQNVTQVEKGAFSFCKNLSTAQFPAGVTRLEDNLFRGCTKLKSFSHGEVTYIGPNAFNGCTNLQSIDISRHIARIEEGTYKGCDSLTSIYVHAAMPPEVVGDNFSELNYSKATLYVPRNVVEAYRNAPVWCNFKKIETLDEEPLHATIAFGKSEITVFDEDAPFTVPLTYTTDGSVSFTSSDESVASVDPSTGMVTPHAPGTAVITATASMTDKYQQVSDSYTVTVRAVPYVTDITFVSDAHSSDDIMRIGENFELSVLVSPIEALELWPLIWTSSDPDVVTLETIDPIMIGDTISAAGSVRVKCLKEGNAVITATVNNMSGTFTARVRHADTHDADVTVDSITYHCDVFSLTANIIGVDKQLNTLRIPESITVNMSEFAVVDTIPSKVFERHKTLEHIIIPPYIKLIGESAFYGCQALKSVIIEDSDCELILSGTYHFGYCPADYFYLGRNTSASSQHKWANFNAKKIVIGGKTTKLDEFEFDLCNEVEEIDIQAPITNIPSRILVRCPKLQRVSFPETLAQIDSYLLETPTDLKELTLYAPLPPSVISWTIRDEHFSDITLRVPYETIQMYKDHPTWGKFLSIEALPQGSISLPVTGSIVFEKTEVVTRFPLNQSSTEPVNPANILTTAPVTYSSSDTDIAEVDPVTGTVTIKNVGKVTITATAEANDIFSATSASYTLNILPPFINSTVIDGIVYTLNNYYKAIVYDVLPGTTKISIEKSVEINGYTYPVEVIFSKAFDNYIGESSIIIPSFIELIDDKTFSWGNYITHITLEESDGTIELGAYPFEDIEFIRIGRNFKFPDGRNPFFRLKNLKDLVLDGNFTELHSSDFYGCTALETVTIKAPITQIPSGPLRDCPEMKAFYVHLPVPPVSHNNFYGYYSTVELHVPKGSLEAYRNADDWQGFINIIDDLEPIVFSSVNNPLADTHSGYTVYNINGVMIKQSDNLDDLNDLPSGIYIVRHGSTVTKIIR